MTEPRLAHGAASIEKAMPSTSASRGTSGVLPATCGAIVRNSSSTRPAPTRPPSSRGAAFADDEVEVASGQRREDRVLLDALVIAGDDDLHRSGEVDAPEPRGPGVGGQQHDRHVGRMEARVLRIDLVRWR